MTRPVDGKALASGGLALGALLLANYWLLATLLAVAAIACALASRRTIKSNPTIRGTTLAILGMLAALGVLVFKTIGPSVVVSLLFLLAPPP